MADLPLPTSYSKAPSIRLALRPRIALFVAISLSALAPSTIASAATWERGSRAYQGFISFGIGSERGSRLSIECDSDGTNGGSGTMTFTTRNQQQRPSGAVRMAVVDPRTKTEVAAFAGEADRGGRSELKVSISLDDDTARRFRSLLRYLGQAPRFTVSIASLNISETFEVSGGWSVPAKHGCNIPS